MVKIKQQLIEGYDKMDRLNQAIYDARNACEVMERYEKKRIIEERKLSEADYLRIKNAPQN
jgi:hypothetical protein